MVWTPDERDCDKPLFVMFYSTEKQQKRSLTLTLIFHSIEQKSHPKLCMTKRLPEYRGGCLENRGGCQEATVPVAVDEHMITWSARADSWSSAPFLHQVVITETSNDQMTGRSLFLASQNSRRTQQLHDHERSSVDQR